ncbi:MAG: sulfatase [Armatimonadota bacterium]
MAEKRHVTRRELLKALGGGALGLGATLQSAHAKPRRRRRPNIVLIFADDAGYGDLSCYGSGTIKTPHLDRLATEGVRLTDFYVCASVCTPSRAGLLTGRYQIRSGLTRVLFPRDETGILDYEVTLAEGLKSAGYATCCIGKWHLGHLPQFRPTQHGFDQYLGILYSNDMDKGKPPLYRNDEIVEEPADQATLTERYTQEAIEFITAHQDEPFFVYLPHTMPHVPLYVSERFAGRSAGGIYGDVIECIDWGVGQIADALDRLGLADNTLLIFTSDNGPWLSKKEHGGSAGPLRDGKFSAYEGGVREPFIARWPGQIPAGSVCRQPAISLDLYTTCLRLAGVEPPRDRPVDGRNILPLLKGAGRSPHDILCFYVGNQLHAVRSGRWKLHVRKRGAKDPAEAGLPELYDLRTDIGETTNVAAEHPKLVKRLQKRIAEFEAEIAASTTPRS